MPEVHQVFVNAGEKAGLEIWRIEDFEPVPVPSSHFGNFYSGDSYIVLKTTGNETRRSWDIHFWLGSKTSQDEACAAAILTVNLDDQHFQGAFLSITPEDPLLGPLKKTLVVPLLIRNKIQNRSTLDGIMGAAIQHRELQYYESKQFLSYFQPAIRYLDGGHSTGFSHVTINAGAEKRLFQVKGKRDVRVKQVKPTFDTLNKGDCFVLDVDRQIYLYVGEKAKGIERLKAITVANQIRDQDHNGRAHIEIIEQESSESDLVKFFEALGSGDQESVAEATDGGDDEHLQEFEKDETKEVSLSEISDSTGSIRIKKLPPPLSKEQLDTKECYVLDTGSYSGIYVWVGRGSNEKEKAEAMKRTEEYLKTSDYPPWVHVSKIPEGAEPTAFIQYFDDWN